MVVSLFLIVWCLVFVRGRDFKGWLFVCLFVSFFLSFVRSSLF